MTCRSCNEQSERSTRMRTDPVSRYLARLSPAARVQFLNNARARGLHPAEAVAMVTRSPDPALIARPVPGGIYPPGRFPPPRGVPIRPSPGTDTLNLREPPGLSRGCGSGTSAYQRACYPDIQDCAMRATKIPSVIASAQTATLIEVDYAQLDTYGQVLEAMEFLEFNVDKRVNQVTAITTAPTQSTATIPLVSTGNWTTAIGILVHWQVAYQLSSPVNFTLETQGFVNIGQQWAGAAPVSIDRKFTGTLAPRVNGGDLYIPFAFRSKTTMDTAAVQLGYPTALGDPPPPTIVTIDGPPAADFTFVIRPLGAFNLETGRFVDNLSQLIAKKVAKG